jgi:hypothetical protein
MRKFCRTAAVVLGIPLGLSAACLNTHAFAQTAPPAKKPVAKKAAPAPKTTAEEDKVTAELSSGDESAIGDAVGTMKEWGIAGKYANEFANPWLPQLLKDKHYQDAADIALATGLSSPHTLEPMMEIRAQAFITLNEMPQALEAAKCVYNLTDLKNTATGVQFFALCLSRAHPADPTIASKFRDEQAAASAGGATTQSSGATLKSISVDPQPYADAIQTWSSQLKFANRIEYGDLLLAADRCDEAEKTFRELYELAASQAELDMAAEGIARSIRDEDGNVARANAWLLSLQKTAAEATPTQGQ